MQVKENIIDEINVWKWDKEYYNNTVLDGTQWELLIKRKGRRKRRIYGSNKYPENFKDFENCINKLTQNILISEEE